MRRRVKKIAGGTTTYFQYDVFSNLIAETDASGATIREYIYMDDERISLREHTGDGETVETVFYYYLNDHLGTPQVMLNEADEPVWSATYLPFGKAEVQVDQVTNPHRFPGQYYDEETGFHYNFYRYYDPDTGRYLTPDPIGLIGGINLYEYVSNNPINLSDPEGLQSEAVIFFAVPKIPVPPPALAATAALGSGWLIGTWINDNYVVPWLWNENSNNADNSCSEEKRKGSGKSEPHGDGGRAFEKANEQVKELQKQLKHANKKEQK